MTLDLEPQVRDYTEYFVSTTRPIELDEILTDRIGLAPVRPLQRRPQRRGVPHWVYGVATAVGVLAAVGGLALLLNFLGDREAPIEDEPPLESTTTTTLASTTTLAVEPPTVLPAEPTGTGPELSFVAVDSPPGLVHDVAWFRDAFYALTADETLHRSTDGLVWEEVTSFDAAWSDDPSAPDLSFGDEWPPVMNLVAAVDRLVAGRAVMDLEQLNGMCYDGPLRSAVLEIGVSADGSGWAPSRIPVDIPAPSDDACIFFAPGPVAAGPAGIMVSGTLHVEVDYRAFIAAHLGEDVRFSTSPAAIDGELRFRTEDGTDHRIPFDEVGLSEELVASRGANVLAWWSPDGTTWRAVTKDGPLRSDWLDHLVATDTGFLAVGSIPGLFTTEDGTSWETVELAGSFSLEDWDGSALVFASSSGLTRFGDSEPLPANEGLAGSTDRVTAGGAGIVAEAFDQWPRVDLVYSPDGITWRRWTPTEFDGAPIQAVWVGGDRVLILTHDGCCDNPSLAVDHPPTLWVGRPG